MTTQRFKRMLRKRKRAAKKNRERRARCWSAQGGRCFWCRAFVEREQATLEHLVPLSRGGTNEPSNLAMACLTCNQKRGNLKWNSEIRENQ